MNPLAHNSACLDSAGELSLLELSGVRLRSRNHELRNRLMKVLNCTALLREDCPGELQELVCELEQEATALSRSVEAIIPTLDEMRARLEAVSPFELGDDTLESIFGLHVNGHLPDGCLLTQPHWFAAACIRLRAIFQRAEQEHQILLENLFWRGVPSAYEVALISTPPDPEPVERIRLVFQFGSRSEEQAHAVWKRLFDEAEEPEVLREFCKILRIHCFYAPKEPATIELAIPTLSVAPEPL